MKYRIDVRSMFGYNTGQPIVVLVLTNDNDMEVEVQMTPAKAREIGTMLFGAAEAAIGDAYMYSFLAESLGVDMARTAIVMNGFRKWRQDHRVDQEKEGT